MSRYEKKLKDKLDDEIKLAGLEAQGKSKQSSGKGKQNGKSWPMSESKRKGKEKNGKSNRKVSRERNTQTKAKAPQKACHALNNRNQQQTQSLTNLNRRIP